MAKSTYENESTITKDDISALREADTICIHWDKDGAGRRDEEYSTIRAIKKNTLGDNGIWDKNGDVERGIKISQKFDNYASEFKSSSGYTFAKCFAYLTYQNEYGTKRQMGAIAHTLRAGDKLTVLWRFGNGNNYLTNARTSVDKIAVNERLYLSECFLIVERGKHTLEFPVMSSLCVYNTASTIKF